MHKYPKLKTRIGLKNNSSIILCNIHMNTSDIVLDIERYDDYKCRLYKRFPDICETIDIETDDSIHPTEVNIDIHQSNINEFLAYASFIRMLLDLCMSRGEKPFVNVSDHSFQRIKMNVLINMKITIKTNVMNGYEVIWSFINSKRPTNTSYNISDVRKFIYFIMHY